LSQVAADKQITIGLNTPPALKLLGQNLRAEYQPLRSVLEAGNATLSIHLKSTRQPTPFGDTLSFAGQLVFADGQEAIRAYEGAKIGLVQLQKDLRELLVQMEKESGGVVATMEKAGKAPLVPIILWVTQFGNRFEDSLSSLVIQKQERAIDMHLSLVADVPEWSVHWARFTVLSAQAGKVTPPSDAAMNIAACQVKLGQLAEAMRIYHDKQAQERLPAQAKSAADGKPLLSWRVMLLPVLGEHDLFRQFHLDEPWDSAHNYKLLEKMPNVYTSPKAQAPKPTTTHYQVFVGKDTLFEDTNGLLVGKIGKAAAKTLLIVEAAEPVPWTKPQDLDYDPNGKLPKLGDVSTEGFCVAFLDGTTRFIKKSIDAKTLHALISRTDSQRIDLSKLP
jgi:hypothetical protein